jgi:ribosomal protein L29
MKVEKAFYAINSHYAEEDLDVMELMLKTELREEIYALAHEQLGNHAKAKELRDFIAKKEKRLV